MSIKDDIRALVAEYPGPSVPEIANVLGRDPRNTRRDIAELRDRGEIVARKDEAGIDRYYPGHVAEASSARLRLDSISRNSATIVDQGVEQRHEPFIEGSFREVPPETPNRALVPQPADSRMAVALAQHAAAQSRPAKPAFSVPSAFSGNLDAMFAEPDAALNEANATINEAERLALQNERRQFEQSRAAGSRELVQRAPKPGVEQAMPGIRHGPHTASHVE